MSRKEFLKQLIKNREKKGYDDRWARASRP
jgi:hypothetical protein